MKTIIFSVVPLLLPLLPNVVDGSSVPSSPYDYDDVGLLMTNEEEEKGYEIQGTTIDYSSSSNEEDVEKTDDEEEALSEEEEELSVADERDDEAYDEEEEQEEKKVKMVDADASFVETLLIQRKKERNRLRRLQRLKNGNRNNVMYFQMTVDGGENINDVVDDPLLLEQNHRDLRGGYNVFYGGYGGGRGGGGYGRGYGGGGYGRGYGRMYGGRGGARGYKSF